MKSTAVRCVALGLFLTSLPATLLSGSGNGWLVDPTGWQGYEIVFLSPLLIPLGAYFVIPLLIANLYVLVGMWMTRAPFWFHCVCWAMFIPSTLFILHGFHDEGIYLPFWLLVAAWIISGVGAMIDRTRGKTEESGSVRPR